MPPVAPAATIGLRRKEALMTAAAVESEQSVRVHETPHEIHVEIELPPGEGEPQVMLMVSRHGVDVRVFRPLEPGAAFHSNPNATPT